MAATFSVFDDNRVKAGLGHGENNVREVRDLCRRCVNQRLDRWVAGQKDGNRICGVQIPFRVAAPHAKLALAVVREIGDDTDCVNGFKIHDGKGISDAYINATGFQQSTGKIGNCDWCKRDCNRIALAKNRAVYKTATIKKTMVAVGRSYCGEKTRSGCAGPQAGIAEDGHFIAIAGGRALVKRVADTWWGARVGIHEHRIAIVLNAHRVAGTKENSVGNIVVALAHNRAERKRADGASRVRHRGKVRF